MRSRARQAAGRRSRPARPGAARRCRGRSGPAARPARPTGVSASTSARAGRSPPSTSPASPATSGPGQHPGRGVGRAVQRRGALVAPPPGEPLLRPAAGRGPALQVGPVGRRAEHHPVPGDADGMRAAADQDQPERAQPGQVVQQRLHRLAAGADRLIGPNGTTMSSADGAVDRRITVTVAPSVAPSVTGQRPPLRPANRFDPADQPVRRHLDRDRRRPCGAWSRPHGPVRHSPPTRRPTAARSGPDSVRADGAGPVVGQGGDVVDDAAAAAQPDDVLAGGRRLPGGADQQLRFLPGHPPIAGGGQLAPGRSAGAAPGRRRPDRSATTPGWPPASVSASACPRWNIARSGRSSTNR